MRLRYDSVFLEGGISVYRVIVIVCCRGFVAFYGFTILICRSFDLLGPSLMLHVVMTSLHLAPLCAFGRYPGATIRSNIASRCQREERRLEAGSLSTDKFWTCICMVAVAFAVPSCLSFISLYLALSLALSRSLSLSLALSLSLSLSNPDFCLPSFYLSWALGVSSGPCGWQLLRHCLETKNHQNIHGRPKRVSHCRRRVRVERRGDSRDAAVK